MTVTVSLDASNSEIREKLQELATEDKLIADGWSIDDVMENRIISDDLEEDEPSEGMSELDDDDFIEDDDDDDEHPMHGWDEDEDAR